MPLDPKLREFLKKTAHLNDDELQKARSMGDDQEYINRSSIYESSKPIWTLKSPEEQSADNSVENRLMTPKKSGMGDVKQADRNYDEDVRQATMDILGTGAANATDVGTAMGYSEMNNIAENKPPMNTSMNPSDNTKPSPSNVVDFGTGTINTLENLKKAQEQSNDNRFYSRLFRGLNTLGAGIAGGDVVNDDAFEDMIKDSDRPIEQFKQMGEQEKNDPNSPISRGFREYAKQFGIELKGDVSAKNAEELIPFIFKGYEAQLNREKDIQIAKERSEDRRLQREMMQTQKEIALGAKKDEQNNKYVFDSSNRLIKHSDSFAKIRRAKNMIDEAVKNPSGVKDVSALYATITGFDPDSVVREGEISLANKAKGLFGTLDTQLSQISANPRLLNQTVLKDMQKTINNLYGIAENEYGLRRDVYLKQAKSRGIPEERYSEIDPYYQTGNQTKPNEVERKTQDGKIAIFDANTKQFLRYK